MALLIEQNRQPVRLRPVGEWDIAVQRELEAELLDLLDLGARSFLIDLAAAHHIHYRVLPELKSLYLQLRRLGAELALASPDSYLLEILAAGDIPRTIPVFPSEASAAIGMTVSSAASQSIPQEGEREGSGLCY